jgi:hypothetical protein
VLIGQRRRRQVLAHIRGAEEYLLKHRLPLPGAIGAPTKRQRS